MTWDLSRLTENQRRIIERALGRCDFPFDKLRKQNIPVEFADLSRYNVAAMKGGHAHVHEDGDTGHVLAAEFDGRRAALGLAWYSGKISIEQRIENDPELAAEVFLAEGAHMVDFFYMTKDHKRQIFAAYHGGSDTAHGHDWFDDEEGVGDDSVRDTNYWGWVGESFMSGFIHAYAPSQPQPMEARQPWVHRTTPEIASRIREILTPAPPPPPPAPEPEAPAPPPSPGPPPAPSEFVGFPRSKVYHKPTCRLLRHSVRERVLTTDELDKRRPCRYCRPTR